LSELRSVPENKLINKGKPLTEKERNLIISEFNVLIHKGYSQKVACDNISNKYGRGYWSILNIVENMKIVHQNTTTTTTTTTLFD
jgi:hypothetical protein